MELRSFGFPTSVRYSRIANERLLLLPFAVDLKGGFEDDGYGGEAEKGHECHEKVGGGEERPGFHLVVCN